MSSGGALTYLAGTGCLVCCICYTQEERALEGGMIGTWPGYTVWQTICICDWDSMWPWMLFKNHTQRAHSNWMFIPFHILFFILPSVSLMLFVFSSFVPVILSASLPRHLSPFPLSNCITLVLLLPAWLNSNISAVPEAKTGRCTFEWPHVPSSVTVNIFVLSLWLTERVQEQ